MSKKKNTLKDLDDFLKQQASSLVAPTSLREKIDAGPVPKPAPTAQPEPAAAAPAPESAPAASPAPATPAPAEVTADSLLRDLQTLAAKDGDKFRDTFYNLIVRTLEQQQQSLPEDMMLINTALYLQSGDNWKEVIRQYWSKK